MDRANLKFDDNYCSCLLLSLNLCTTLMNSSQHLIGITIFSCDLLLEWNRVQLMFKITAKYISYHLSMLCICNKSNFSSTRFCKDNQIWLKYILYYFHATFGLVSVNGSEVACPTGFFMVLDHCFQLESKPLDWFQAYANCQAKGGSLTYSLNDCVLYSALLDYFQTLGK